MDRILVGFDGSEGSEQALNRAIMLINNVGELVLIAVIPKPKDKSLVDVNAYDTLKKKAWYLINGVITDLDEQSFEIKGLVEEGDPASVIIDVSDRLDVDLIILGSKGQSELGQYLIGSVANKVVQYAAKPVMIVR